MPPRKIFRKSKRNPSNTRRQTPFFSTENDQSAESKTPFFNPQSAGVQAKLKVNQSGDPFEKEADNVADAVVNNKSGTEPIQRKEISRIQRMEAPKEEEKIQKQAEEEEEPVQMMEEKEPEEPVQMQGEEEEETVQAKSEGGTGGEVAAGIASKINNSRGGGDDLPQKTRSEMEPAIGADFSSVKIHKDRKAAELSDAIGAQAFTIGNDIYFNKGKYDPETSKGKHLLAHELTHVVQQNAGLKSETLQQKPVTLMHKREKTYTKKTWADKVKSAHEKVAKKDIPTAEAEFLALFNEAVPDHRFPAVNMVTGTEKVSANLKEGLNIDVTKTDYPGQAGFLLPDGTFTGKLPITLNETPPPSTIVLGRDAFTRESPLVTLATFIHEKNHYQHQKTSIDILLKWRKSLNKKDKARILAKGEDSVTMQNEFIVWVQDQAVHKKLPTPDYALAINAADSGGHTGNTEILSALAAFMGTFHLTDPDAPPSFVMTELTNYPVNYKYWSSAPESIKTYYLETLFNYYCGTLSDPHKRAFDAFVTRAKETTKDKTGLLDKLSGFQTASCTKPKSKKKK